MRPLCPASFVHLFASLLLIATGGCVGFPLKLSPSRVVVRYGDPVTINCSSLTNQIQPMGWEAPMGGTQMESRSYSVWIVERLTDWDISPMCFLWDLNGTPTQWTSKPTVVLYTFPDSIHISSNAGSDRSMTERTAYNFTCDVPNVAPVMKLTVRLHREDKVIHNRTFNHPGKKPVSQSSAFEFIPSRDDNNATFRCEALLDLEPDGPKLRVVSEPYTITVKYGPVVLCKNSIQEGGVLGSLCDVTGNPTPTITWHKDGKRVEPTLGLHRGYTGEYKIEAEGLTLVEKRLQPAICYGPELSCPSEYTVVEHTPHNLTCTVEGYPRPKISWFKDDEEVELPEKLTRRDAGQYLILAENDNETVNATVDITVIYPPSDIAELEDTEVDVGSPVWLKCSSVGNPRPQYVWNYYRSDNVVEENDDGVSRLWIQNATVLNMGSYTCQARNNLGNVSETVEVHVKGPTRECPIKISPEKMVIRYQSEGQNVTCEPTTSGSRNIEGEVSWQPGIRTDGATLPVDPSIDWDLQPVCMATFTGIGMCQKALQFTLYKTPDSVSLRHVDDLSAVVENQQFQLRCDITGVAPAQNVTVLWYQGNKTVQSIKKSWQGSLHVTSCLDENVTGCDLSVTRTPVDVSSIITIALDRSDSGATFWCEARLDLGPDGPQPPPTVASSPLNLTVYYKPSINTTKLPKVIPVFQGYPEELVCQAEGQPPPKIQWFYSADKVPHVSGEKLLVTEAGYYNCCATNEVDSIFYVVEVISKGKHAESCPVEISPQSAAVRFGDPLWANCTAFTEQIKDMGWESTQGGQPLTSGVRWLPLNISSVTDWGLRPICYVNPLKSPQCKKALPVTVYKVPDEVLMSGHAGLFVQDQEYKMQCDVFNVAPVKKLLVRWYKGNRIVHTETFDQQTVYPVNALSTFTLRPIMEDHGSLIRCEAAMSQGADLFAIPSRADKMEVLFPPIFPNATEEELQLQDTSPLLLNCTASGNPVPAYSWDLPDPIQLAYVDSTTSQLALKPLLQLPGIYRCMAKNSQGTTTKAFTVIEPERNRTTFAGIVGGLVALGVLLVLAGLWVVTPDGSFDFSRGAYQKGRPASSGPV